MSTSLGQVDNASFWSQNSIISASGGEVVLTATANSDTAGLAYTGSGLPKEGNLISNQYVTGTTGQVYIGYVDSAVTPSTVTGSSVPASFTGVRIFDMGTSQANKVGAYYSGTDSGVYVGSGSNFFGLAASYHTLQVSFAISGTVMTIKLYTDDSLDPKGVWTGTAPSFTTMRPVFFTSNGGAFANNYKVNGTPVWQAAADIAPPSALYTSSLVGDTVSSISFASVPQALSYDWRVNGGSNSNVLDALIPEYVMTGFTANFANTLEIRSNTGSTTSAWKSFTIQTATTCYWLDNFNRADATSPLGTPTTGTGYTASTGTWGISSKAAYTSTSTAKSRALITGTGVADVDITLNATNAATRGLVFRHLDASNYWLLLINGSNNLVVQKYVAGALSTVFSGGSASVARVVATAHRFWVFDNGILVEYFEDPFNQTATGLGLYIDASTAARIDGVVANNAPADPAGLGTLAGFAYLGRDTKDADIAGVT